MSSGDDLVEFALRALKHAPQALRDDERVVLVAIGLNPAALQYASPRLRASRHVVKQALVLRRLTLQYADPALQDDLEIVRDAVKAWVGNFRSASTQIREDRECLRTLCSVEGVCVRYIANDILTKEFLTSLHYHKIFDVYKELVKKKHPLIVDIGVVQYFVKTNSRIYRMLPSHLQEMDAVALCATGDPRCLHNAPDTVKNSAEFVRAMVREHGTDQLLCASLELRDDVQFMGDVFNMCPDMTLDDIRRFAGPVIRANPESIMGINVKG